MNKRILLLFAVFFAAIQITLNAQVDSTPFGNNSKTQRVQNKKSMPLAFAFDLNDSIASHDSTATAAGNAAVVYLNGKFWVSKWQSDTIAILDRQGSVDSLISIAGLSTVRSFTTDGTSIFAGNSSDNIYAINPVSYTLDSIISLPSSSVGSRMTTYDPSADNGNGGFWIGDFDTDIELYSRTGNLLRSIAYSTHNVADIYGGALDTLTPGGPYLAVYSQDNGGNAKIEWIDVATGTPAGMVYNTQIDLLYTQNNNPDPIAGGLFISTAYNSTYPIMMGVLQGAPDVLFGYEMQIMNCAQSTDLSASSLDSSQIELNWTAGGGTSWNIEYGVKGFTPGTGTKISNVATANYIIGGLLPNTAYDFYIEDSCASGLSFWAGPISAATQCTAVMAPYTEDFNHSGSIPNCWVMGTSSDDIWEYTDNYGSTTVGNDGNVTSSSASGGYFAYVDDSYPYGTGTSMESSFIDVSNLMDPFLTFYLISDSEGEDNATFSVDLWDGTMWHNNIFVSNSNTYQGEWQKIEILLDTFSFNSAIKLRFLVTDNNTYHDEDDVAIDDVSIVEAPSCMKPTGLYAINVTGTSADLGWTENNVATEWQIEYDTVGFALGTGNSQIVTSNPATIGGLSPTTSYEYYVRAICGRNDTSEWTLVPYRFVTPCLPYSAPFFNGFEAEPDNEIPACWEEFHTYNGTYSSSFVEVRDLTGSNAAFIGDNALYLYSSAGSTSDTLMAFTPPLSDLTAGDKEIRFYANAGDTALKLVVGTVSGPLSKNYHPIDTISFASEDNYKEVIVEFTTANGYNGTDGYIYLQHNMAATNEYIRIDQFNYELIKSCKNPVELGISSLSSTSAELSWTERYVATEWEIEYGTAGFAQNTGTKVLVSSKPFTITGLSPNTSYDFYVRAVCGRNDSSYWSGPFSFTSLCAPVNTYPYTQKFNTFLPNCWEEAGEGNPNSGPSDLGNSTWDSDDYLNDAAKGDAIKVNLYHNNRREWIISEPFDLSASASQPYELKLKAGMTVYGETGSISMGSDDEVQILISADGGLSWNSLYTWTSVNEPSNTGDIVTLSLASYTDTNYVFAIWASDGAVNDPEDYDFFITDFEIRETPTCLEPYYLNALNVTSNSADLTWVENGLATKWEVEYGPTGFAFGTGTDSIVGTNPFALNSLSPNTYYDFYVRSICGAGDSSFWSGPYTFVTPHSIPFVEDFNSFGVISYNFEYQGWYDISPSYSAEWETDSTITDQYTGPKADHTDGYGGIFAYLYTSYSAGDTAYLMSPDIYVDTNLSTVALSFWYHKFGVDMGNLEVYVFSNGVKTLLDSISGQTHFSKNEEWKKFTTFLTAYQGETIQIGFAGISGGSDGAMAIDDVSINEVYPNNAGVAAVSSTSINCAGTYALPVEVKNFGSNIINSVWVKYSINGAMDSVYFTGSILPNQSELVNLNPYNFALNANYDLVVFTEMPNGMADTIKSNDSLHIQDWKTGLSGAYTIDSSQPASVSNYLSFAAAVDDLETYGLCGSVTFNVAPGIYKENIVLSNISGASSVNSITFDGTDSSMVIVENSNNSVATLILGKAEYITFTNLTIRQTNDEAAAVLFGPDANHNIISNSVLKASETGLTDIDSRVLVFSGNTASTSESGGNASFNTIANNRLLYGNYGISLNADRETAMVNNKIINNQIDSVYNYGIHASYNDSLEIVGNTINANNGGSSADGINLSGGLNTILKGNYVHASDYGVYITHYNTLDDRTKTRNVELINNMVISDSDDGLYLYYINGMDILHNTVRVFGSSPAVNIRSSSTRPIGNYDVRNNIFDGGSELAIEVTEVDTIFNAFDYNIYYSSGTNVAEIEGNLYPSVSALQSSHPQYNVHSLQGQPQYASNYNLHMLNNLANNKGDNSLAVVVDIDGETRPIGKDTVVDIGADEFQTLSCATPSTFAVISRSLNSVQLHLNSPALEFQYEFGLSGYIQGSADTLYISQNDSITIDSLKPSTTYDLYIRSVCAPGDTSMWAGPFSFRTVNGIPFFEDFESFGNAGGIGNGWTNVSSTALDWLSGSSTVSSSTGPDMDHTVGVGGLFMYLEASNGSPGDSADLVSSPITVGAEYEMLKLEFWYHKYGADMADLKVFADSNGVSNQVALIKGETHSSATESWTSYTAYLSDYDGDSIRLRFRGTRGSGYLGDMAIDDVSLTAVSSIDLAINSILQPFEDSSYCYSPNEGIIVNLTNSGYDSLDFTIDTAVVNMQVGGAINFNLHDTIADNSINGTALPFLSSINFAMGSVDMSVAGDYYFEISVKMSNDGKSSNDVYRDTVKVLPSRGGVLSGPDTICAGDFVTLSVSNSIGRIQWQAATAGVYTDILGADSTSLIVNPTSSTSYRVVACDTAYSDTLLVEAIVVDQAIANDSLLLITCGDTGTVALVASSTDPNVQYRWYDVPTGGKALSEGGNISSISANGDTLYYTRLADPNRAASDTFYVAAFNPNGRIENVGPVDLGIGTYGGWSSTAQKMYFDVLNPTSIESVDIFFDAPVSSSFTIEITDVNTSAVVYTYSGTTTVNSTALAQTVPINANLQAGSYAMNFASGANPGTYRNNNGAVYPYIIPGVISITGNSFDPQYYYMFYNWKVNAGCESLRDTAIATIDCLVGVEEAGDSFANIAIYPNPSNGIFTISGNKVDDAVRISIYNSNGKLIYQSADEYINNFDEQIDISGFSKGIYFVKLQSATSMEMKKILLQ